MPLSLKLTIDRSEPLLRGQDHFWRIARALGSDSRLFTATEVAELCVESHVATIVTWLRRLSIAGIVEAAGSTPNPRHQKPETRWRLLRAPQTAPIVSRDGKTVRPRSSRQQMWNVMRGPSGRSGFTYADLVAYGSTDDVSIAANTAKSYIQELRRGGYLLQLDPGGPARPAIWRLRAARNTGPLAPMVLTAKLVFDQNKSKVLGDTIAEEVSEQ